MVNFPHLPHFRGLRADVSILKALLAEFIGVLLFQLLAGTVGDSPAESAITFAALLYGLKHLSGGHLNPAVSIAASASGHIEFSRALLYVAAQVLGAITGALLQVAFIPEANIGKDFAACISPAADLNGTELFLWEFALTTFFIIVTYSAIFVRPGHGIASPVAGGLALFAVLSTGGRLTGFSPVNPARNLAAAIIFKCWSYLHVYVLAQLAAAAAAAAWVWTQHGKGYFFGGEGPINPLDEALLAEQAGEGGLPSHGHPHGRAPAGGLDL